MFKNYKTKRQLKKEIKILESLITPQRPIIYETSRDVQKIGCTYEFESNMPVEHIKERLSFEMAKHLKPFIEYDIEDNPAGYNKKILRGSLYV